MPNNSLPTKTDAVDLVMPLKIGDTIGIVGGGQLGRMLSIAAKRLGFRTVVLDPNKDCPAAALADKCIVADYGDQAAMMELAATADAATYEFENLSISALSALSKRVFLAPSVRALEVAQDRLNEKRFISNLGIPIAPYWRVESDGSESRIISEPKIIEKNGSDDNCDPSFPALLKTRKQGYDGKGQIKVKSSSEIQNAHARLQNVPAILEDIIPFGCEVSVIGVRDLRGNFKFFQPSENKHEDGILRTSKIPSSVSNKLLEQLADATHRIMEKLEYIGVLTAEFFVVDEATMQGSTEDARSSNWYLNEIAPRVHNSGHWTIEAAYSSQFEQHIRAIAGWQLGSCETREVEGSHIVMENLLGDEIFDKSKWLGKSRCWYHNYGKSEAKALRKMGHVTFYQRNR